MDSIIRWLIGVICRIGSQDVGVAESNGSAIVGFYIAVSVACRNSRTLNRSQVMRIRNSCNNKVFENSRCHGYLVGGINDSGSAIGCSGIVGCGDGPVAGLLIIVVEICSGTCCGNGYLRDDRSSG